MQDQAAYDANINWPKISIITPSLNQGNFIEETIRSVLLQNYPNLEYIIIDGGSNDNTIEIIKRYESSISYWVSEPDKGQADAINKGIKKASGEIINWLNSDDYYEEGALFKIATAFIENPEIKCISAKERRIDAKGKFKNYSFGSYLGETLEETIITGHIDQPSTFFRSEVFKKIPSINQNFKFCFDIDLWIRFLLEFGMSRVCCIPDIVATFRYHKNSKTLNYISAFRKEQKNIYLSIAKQMGIIEKLCVYLKMESVPDSISAYSVEEINRDFFIELLGNKYAKYENDKSLELREISSYYLIMGLYGKSLTVIIKVVFLDPFRWINYKFFIHILFKCLTR